MDGWLDKLFGDADFEMECPGCQYSFTVKFGELTKEHAVVTCPNCKSEIEIQHHDSVQKARRDMDKAMRDFEKSLKRFSK